MTPEKRKMSTRNKIRKSAIKMITTIDKHRVMNVDIAKFAVDHKEEIAKNGKVPREKEHFFKGREKRLEREIYLEDKLRFAMGRKPLAEQEKGFSYVLGREGIFDFSEGWYFSRVRGAIKKAIKDRDTRQGREKAIDSLVKSLIKENDKLYETRKKAKEILQSVS